MDGHAKKATGEWESPGRARHGRKWGWSGGSWWSFPFGLVGPIIGAAIGLVFIVISLWALSLLNAAVQSQFITLLIASVGANIWVFFAFSLAMGYLDFLSKHSPLAYALLTPISSAAAITFTLWVMAWVFRTVGNLAGVDFLAGIGAFLRENLLIAFIIFLLLGYLSVWIIGRRGRHG